MAHRVSRGLFTDSIKKVLSQTHPVLSISNDAIHFLDIQVSYHLYSLFFFERKKRKNNF